MSFVGSNILAGASGQGGATGYAIERSLRFNSGDSAYLNRTPSAAGNQKTWTWSGWIKFNSSSAQSFIFGANGYMQLYFGIGKLYVDETPSGGSYWTMASEQVFRDLSAWYHFIFVYDTTQSTASNRFKAYVNGNEITDWTADTRSNIVQDSNGQVNSTNEHRIGRQPGNNVYANAYLADVHFIDGQALAPTDFGETDDNGVWQPKAFAGTYGPLVDQSQTWSNIATLSGGGVNSSHPLTQGFNGSLSNRVEGDTNGEYLELPISTTIVSGGVRVYAAVGSTTPMIINLYNGSSNVHTTTSSTSGGRWHTTTYAGPITKIRIERTGRPFEFDAVEVNGKLLVDSGVTVTDNSFHLDFKDNSSNAALGTDTSGNSNTWTVNNLIAAPPGLATPNQGMDVVTYSGTSSTQSISSLGFQPDFIWFKARSYAGSHTLVDSVRGVTKQLNSNSTAAEGTNAAGNGLQSFDSNGFTLGNESNANGSTNGSQTYVAWCWKAGGAASSNTDGTITSSVSANASYGFSVVSWTGNSTAGATLGHGLSTVPKMIIVKNRDRSTYGDWVIGHDAINGFQDGNQLYFTSAAVASGEGFFNNTSPTSSVFTVKNNYQVNYSGDNYVAYVWSEVAGFSKFGSWTGNSSSNGPTVTLGFKPRYVIFKRTDTGGNGWTIFDTARDSGTLNIGLEADSSASEQTYSNRQIVVSDTGFQVTSTGSSSNASGGTYIYAAFAAKPDGSVIDSLVDSPSQTATPTDTGAGGEVVGNYATLNPLVNSSYASLSNGNLKLTTASSGRGTSFSTIAVSSGKFYCEIEWDSGSGASARIGVIRSDTDYTEPSNFTDSANAIGYLSSDGSIREGSTTLGTGSSYGVNDIIGVALNMDDGEITFFKNGVSQGTFNRSILDSGSYYFVVSDSSNSESATFIANFGQRSFAFSAPTNFKALCTSNLPEPTIADGSKYFDTKLYNGTGSNPNNITGLSFSPDWVWIKQRSGTRDHTVYDTIRGVTKELFPNGPGGENTLTTGLTSFNGDGFTVSTGSRANEAGNTYVAWNWDGGTSTVTNNDGSIASQVRAQPSAGFSICTFTSPSSGNFTLGHGLSAVPSLILMKEKANGRNWHVFHSSISTGTNKYLRLNDTSSTLTYSNVWGAALPTSSVFGLGVGGSISSNADAVAYCFAPVEGYSAMGSYTGNGSADGPFVYTGHSVAWVMIKRTDTTGSWTIWDVARNTFNVMGKQLYPNDSAAEADAGTNSAYGILDCVSSGFKVRGSHASFNASGGSYIYMSFAENPFKTARAR